MYKYDFVFLRAVLLSVLLGLLVGCDGEMATNSMIDTSSPNGPDTEQSEGTSTFSKSAKGDSSGVIPGQYLVVFKDGTSNVSGLAHGLAKQTGGTVFTSWTTVLQGFAIKGINEKAAQAIEKNPEVKSVSPDMKGSYHVRQSVGSNPGDSWGLDRVNQRNGFDGLYTAGAMGSGVTAYVVDSGVRVSHNTFGSRASNGYDFVEDDGTANDCAGHGTHVAGILGGGGFGIAKNVDIVALRVGDCSAPILSATIDALEWIVNNHSGGPAVANMSVGFAPDSDLNDAVQDVINHGVTTVVSAGNDNADACNLSPAQVSDAITVGASDTDDSRWGSSNYGSCVDLFAPGFDILSAWNGSDSDTNSISGTSMAAPHVAGAAAIRLENYSSETPKQVRDAIVQHSTKNVISNAKSANNHLLYSLLNHPKRPTSLSVTCYTDDFPHLNWTASSSSDIDHYEVLKSSYPSSGYSVYTTTSSTSYDDSFETCASSGNVDDEKFYRVRALDTEGLSSGESNHASALITNETPYSIQSSPTLVDSLSSTVREETPTYEESPSLRFPIEAAEMSSH